MEALKIKKDAESTIKEFLKFLMDKNKVEAVFTLTRMEDGFSYSLIKDKEIISQAVPFYPFMPSNAGKMLSRITLIEPLRKPILAILRPCELRGFIELVKRDQGSTENIFFMSFICPGVFPLKKLSLGYEEELKEYKEKIEKGELSKNIRNTCKACEHFIPYNSDLTISFIGENGKESILIIENEKGENLIQGFEGERIEFEKNFVNMKRERKKERERIIRETEEKGKGLDKFISLFGRCISCHGCSKICPICYCKLCDFDSSSHEIEPSSYEDEVKKRGGIRVPSNVLLYHLGRLIHVSVSCVNCGMCSDICPVDIPVSELFLVASLRVQRLFNYIPGRDYKEEIPLKTFEPEEFTEIAG